MLKFRWETDFQKTELAEIPREWVIKKLGTVVNIKSGKRPTNVDNDSEFEIWGLTD